MKRPVFNVLMWRVLVSFGLLIMGTSLVCAASGDSWIWLEHVAFEYGNPIDITLQYLDLEYEAIVEDLWLIFGDKSYKLQFDGCRYAAQLPKLEEGIYSLQITDSKQVLYNGGIIVWKRALEPNSKGLVYIDDDNYFREADGARYLKMACATLHMFASRDEPVEMMEGFVESSWNNANETVIADWLGYLAINGVNTVKVALMVPWDGIPGDRGGYADQDILDALGRFLQLADSMYLKVVPVFYWGYYGQFGFENEVYHQYIQDQDSMMAWFTDENVISLQKGFIGDVVERFKNDPRIFAWELMNEQPAMLEKQFVHWSNELSDFIRGVGDKHLVRVDFMERNGADMSAFYCKHGRFDFYKFGGFPLVGDYAAFMSKLRPPADAGCYLSAYTRYSQLFDKPGICHAFCQFGEHDLRMVLTRESLWVAFLSGVPGVEGWDAYDCVPGEFKIISQIFADIDWNSFVRKQPRIAVQVRGDGRDLIELMVYDQYFQKNGYDYDVVLTNSSQAELDKYDVVLETQLHSRSGWWETEEFQEPELSFESGLRLSDSYYAVHMTSSDDSTMLIYSRNMKDWDQEGYRISGVSDFQLEVSLEGRYCYTLYDLTTRQTVLEGEFVDTLVCSESDTSCDYAVYIRKVK